MDCKRCLKIIKDYRVGLNILRLTNEFWQQSILVFQVKGSFGLPVKALCGVTQGDLLPLSY